MARLNRSAVYVALQGTIGRELVFKHYTNKVVAAIYPDMEKLKSPEKAKRVKKK